MPNIIVAKPFKKSDFFLIGEEPFAVNKEGDLIQRIQTFFIGGKTLVSTPGIHAEQRLLYIDYLNQERARSGQPKLTPSERDAIMDDSVSIVIQFDDETNQPYIGVRNDSNLSRAVRGMEVLLQAFSKDQVRIF